jgi:hypothetical protein
LASENERKSSMKNSMTRFGLFKALSLTLGCAALVLGAIYASAAPKRSHDNGATRHFNAHAGTTFILAPASTPGGPRSHTIDGVYVNSLLGDCTFHGEASVVPTATPGYSLITGGVFLITTADGLSTLTATAEGTITTNPANPYMGDFEYDVTFTGGSGSLAGAHGSARIHNGIAYFTTCDLVQPGGDSTCEGIVPAGANTGKACWLMDGELDLHH